MKTITEIVRLNTPKKHWNPIYKRFECPRCGDNWNKGELHLNVCQWYQSLLTEARAS